MIATPTHLKPNRLAKIQAAARDELRRGLYRDQGGRCHYCHRPMVFTRQSDTDPRQCTIDHVKPQASGGGWDLSNLVAACRSCNEAKGCDWKGTPRPEPEPQFEVVGHVPMPGHDLPASDPMASLPPEPILPRDLAGLAEIDTALVAANARRNAANAIIPLLPAKAGIRRVLHTEVMRLNEQIRSLKHQRQAKLRLLEVVTTLKTALEAMESLAARVNGPLIDIETRAIRLAQRRLKAHTALLADAPQSGAEVAEASKGTH